MTYLAVFAAGLVLGGIGVLRLHFRWLPLKARKMMLTALKDIDAAECRKEAENE